MRTCFALFAVVCTVQAQRLGPRSTPAEYQSQATAGKVTIAAEFRGHSVPTADGATPLTTEDYIVVEAGFFGPADSRLTLSLSDFTLRVNGKKQGLESLPCGMVVGNLKDPEWEPPEPKASKGGKTSINGGGGGGGDSKDPPAPVKIPIEVQRSMAQRAQKAAMPEGDRALPQAGLLFFKYGGKTKGIHSLELVYDGPAGRASLKLEP